MWLILAVVVLPLFMLLPFAVLLMKKDSAQEGMEGITDADWLPDEVE